MKSQQHITRQAFAEYVSGHGNPEVVGRLEAHLEVCPLCVELLQELHHFTRDLDDSWNRERLFAMGAAHPSAAELERLWSDEPHTDSDAPIRRHVQECASCQDHIRRLETGFSVLFDSDPLGTPFCWPSVIRPAFGVGIEVIVEATRGAYMTAQSLVREVMSPQQTLVFEPNTAWAMGSTTPVERIDGAVWYDARFETDETGGEITGSTNPSTGLGVVTVSVEKALAYTDAAPLVEMRDRDGQKIAEQVALDTGVRYLATFDNLTEGSYLVGIREPHA